MAKKFIGQDKLTKYSIGSYNDSQLSDIEKKKLEKEILSSIKDLTWKLHKMGHTVSKLDIEF